MIHHPRVLDPEEVPDQELIVHRGAHFRDVQEAFRRMAAGETQSPFVLTGPPGTGKTLIARDALRRLAQQQDLRTAYVDCWQDYDDYHLLAQVVDRLDLDVVHHNSTPRSTLVDALQQPAETPRIVVLDELEMVPESEPLQQLADAPGVSVACIVNEPGEITTLLTDAWGRVPAGAQRLEFGRYAVSELVEILSKRAAHGLSGGPVSERLLERMAEAADGDARLGICILREAARHAREAGVDRISNTQLVAAVEAARRQLHQASLERLTAHQRTLYDLLVAAGALSPGELHERYAERVSEPRSRRTIVTYLQKMDRYGLVEATGTTKNRTYRVDTSGYANLDLVC